jgi:hypothetical protein
MDDPITTGSSSEFLLAEPEDQKQARIDERDNVFQAYPVLEGVIARLTERIKFYESIDSITDTSDPATFMHQVEANRLTKINLTSELIYLEELIKAHLQPNIG